MRERKRERERKRKREKEKKKERRLGKWDVCEELFSLFFLRVQATRILIAKNITCAVKFKIRSGGDATETSAMAAHGI